MAMSRFETGMKGNPHQHGFSMGIPGPRLGRVLADVDGAGDVPVELEKESEEGFWEQVLENVFGDREAEAGIERGVLLEALRQAVKKDVCGDGAGEDGEVETHLEPEEEAAFAAKAAKMLDDMVHAGLLGCRADGLEYYRVVETCREVPAEGLGLRRPSGNTPVREGRLGEEQAELDILHDRNVEVSQQSALEKQFAAFFGRMVSE